MRHAGLVLLGFAMLAFAVAPSAGALSGAIASVDVDTHVQLEPASVAYAPPPIAAAVDVDARVDSTARAAHTAPDAPDPAPDAGVAGADEGEPLTKGVVADVPPATATLGGPLLWLAAQGALRALEAGAFAGYARITRADVLKNAHRQRVYRLLQERPGLSPTEVQDNLGLGWGTTVYHLDRLERTGLVKSERSGLSRRFFPATAVGAGERKALAALARPQLQSLAEHVLTTPGLLQRDLAARAGLTPGAIAKQLAALEDAGLVTRERDGRTARVVPTSALADLVGAGPVPGHAPGEGLTAATS